MRRRRFLALAAIAAVSVRPAAIAQQRGAKIGLLRTNSPPDPFVEAFREGMSALGYIEGQSVAYEIRWADGNPDRLPALAAQLAGLKPDVIVAGGETAIRAALQAAPGTPIVMGASNDPVAAGLAQSLARPGGMVTGLTIFSHELSEKRLQLFREALAELDRVGVLVNWRFPTARADMDATEYAARALGITVSAIAVSRAEEFPSAIAGLRPGGVQGLITLADPFFTAHRLQISGLARAARLPTMFHWPEFVEAGGLLSYGPDNVDLYRRASAYVDKILKGARPGDLPIEQPTRLVLAVNLRTARELGLTIPPAILARADEVIE